jgi:hypothetical protein
MGRGALRTRRRYRQERLEEMRVRGIRPARKVRILGVRITAIPMPEWVKERAIKGLSLTESFVWLRRRDARFLMRLDREAGGEPYATETEYRRCKICSRPLIGDAARMRRDLDESSFTGRYKACGSDCIEAERDKRWR